MRLESTAAVLLVAGTLARGAGQEAFSESAAERDARMQWWRDARFGMFIHWGIYAVPAGVYKGQAVDGIGEWIMNSARIPRDEYEQFAREFNPSLYNADEWVALAKQAGMKYIVITSKHHDGFALFDAKNSRYDVVDATPYGKDILRPLSDACARQGLKFCTYHSIMDWHHPAQLPAKMTEDGRPVWNPTRIAEGRKPEFIDYMKGHLEQLVREYGTNVLWFDGEWLDWWTDQDARDIYGWLRAMNPSLIVNNRIGTGRGGMGGFTQEGAFAGDFGTPEQEIPDTGVPGLDWESCMTMNDTWGFKSQDHNWKSTETLVRNLIDIASKGGNYLLNVGPKPDGTIPEASVERLREVGRWMAVNGAAIHGTRAAPFRPAWGRITAKPAEGKLFLHVFDWPADGRLVLPAVPGRPRRAYLLTQPGTALKVTGEPGAADWVISIPASTPDPIAAVIALEIEGS